MNLSDVYCSGCWQKIGVASEKYPNRVKVFCDYRCARDLPVTQESERNDKWQFLNMSGGYKQVAIGHLFGSPHGLVYKTLDRLKAPLLEQPDNWEFGVS